MWALLRTRNFRLLWGAGTLSAIGDQFDLDRIPLARSAPYRRRAGRRYGHRCWQRSDCPLHAHRRVRCRPLFPAPDTPTQQYRADLHWIRPGGARAGRVAESVAALYFCPGQRDCRRLLLPCAVRASAAHCNGQTASPRQRHYADDDRIERICRAYAGWRADRRFQWHEQRGPRAGGRNRGGAGGHGRCGVGVCRGVGGFSDLFPAACLNATEAGGAGSGRSKRRKSDRRGKERRERLGLNCRRFSICTV